MSLSPMLRVSRLVVAAGLAWTALAGLAAGDSAARRTAALPDAERLVIASNRDGTVRPYSIAADGSGLTPLLANGRRLVPVAVSRNGHAIAYTPSLFPHFTFPNAEGPIYVSQATGTGLRRVAKGDLAFGPALSPDGRWLAFFPNLGRISIMRTDGRGRQLTRRACCNADWSPDGRALLLDEGEAIAVLRLHGKRRVVARMGPNESSNGFEETAAKWSPDGRWIAYLNVEDEARKNGLYLVRPNGSRRHRIFRGSVYTVAWSGDGKKLAFTLDSGRVGLIGTDGRGVRLLRLFSGHTPAWSPDGRRFAVASRSGDSTQIWVVGQDGRDVHRVTSEGENSVAGWTRRVPARPPAPPIPPTERVLDARSVATATPVAALSADGTRVAFVVKATTTDCEHAAVWGLGEGSITRFVLPAPCGPEQARAREVALAGSRVAWTQYRPEGEGECSVELESAALGSLQPLGLATGGVSKDACVPDYYHVRGDGELFLFNHELRLVRIGGGRVSCSGRFAPKVCATLRSDALARPVDSVSGALIAVRKPGSVVVLDDHGQLVRRFPFSPADVRAARLDGGRLVVWRFGVLEVYDLATGARVLSRPVPVGFRLVDVDGGVAVLLSGTAIILLRLDDGGSRTITPAGGPVLAELEPAGLYYSYRVGDDGRLVFAPRSELL